MEHPTDYRALYERGNDLLHQEREEIKALNRKYADAQAAVEALRRERDEARDFLNTVTNDLNEQAGELSQLQALVRALPNLEHFDVGVDDHGGEIRLPDGYILFTATSRNRTHALEKLLKYRATLDATTPAVCPDCDGDGAVDSGGTDPNGNPLMRRCGCREKGGDGE